MVEHSQLNQPISTFWWGVRYDLMLRIQLNGPRFFPPISGHFRWGSEVICASGRCSPGIGWPRRGGRWRSAMGGRDVHGYMINDRSMRSDVHKSKNSVGLSNIKLMKNWQLWKKLDGWIHEFSQLFPRPSSQWLVPVTNPQWHQDHQLHPSKALQRKATFLSPFQSPNTQFGEAGPQPNL
jgi:hypothetical protein